MVWMMINRAVPAAPMAVVMAIPEGVIPASPAETPAEVGRRPTPAKGVEAPIPPKAIGIGGECLGIETVVIDVPVKGVQPINNIKIERTADRHGVTGVAEADDTGGILVIIG